MSTCKDCIHEIVCSALIKKGLPWEDGEYPAEAFCMSFRNKADVVEVRHEEWEEIKCGDGMFDYYFKCSNCGNRTPLKAFPIAPDYCPNCGAKMDGERRENG